MAKLVTVATDGFRDYVTLPDGREINLGSVSVLKLVSSLVHGVSRCRKALDAYLKNRQTIISVDLQELEELLKPKRSRWACHDDLFIPIVFRQPFRGAGMTQETTQAEAIKQQIAEIEEHIKLLEQPAKEHAAGSLSEEQVQGAIDSLSKMITELGKKPGGQSDNRYFYAAMDELAKMLNALDKEPVIASEADIVGLQTVTASMLEAALGKGAAAVDQDLKEDLDLYIQNEGALYQDRLVIIRNLMHRVGQDNYDKTAAARLWAHFIDAKAIPKYMKRFRITEADDKYFPPALRKELASDMEEAEKARMDFGDYSNLKSSGELPPALKKYQEEHGKGGDGKKDDDDKGDDDKDKKDFPPWLKGKEAGELPPALKKYQEEHGKGGDGKKDDDKGDKKDLPPWLEKGKDKDASAEAEGVTGPAEQVAKQEGVDNPYAGKDLSDNSTYYKLADKDGDPAKQKNPYAGKDLSDNSTYYKLAAKDVPIINEALANSVMTKIESTLGVVEASTKKNTHIAKSDLDRISSMLSRLITGADLADPSLCAALKELSVMTDKINSYFS